MEQSPWRRCLAKPILQTFSPKLSKRTIAAANCSANVAKTEQVCAKEKKRIENSKIAWRSKIWKFKKIWIWKFSAIENLKIWIQKSFAVFKFSKMKIKKNFLLPTIKTKEKKRKKIKIAWSKIENFAAEHFLPTMTLFVRKSIFLPFFVPMGSGSFLVSSVTMEKSSLEWSLLDVHHAMDGWWDIHQLGAESSFGASFKVFTNWLLLDHLVSHCSESKCLSKEKKRKRRTKRVRLTWQTSKQSAQSCTRKFS